MSSENYLYPVPYKWYTKYGVRKYGFHGMSHQFITNEVRNVLKRDNFKLISCHVGNSGSVCAISDMKCVNTSMGFTPLAGIMMGTRSGDIDPSIIPYIMEIEGKNASEVIDDLNRPVAKINVSVYSWNTLASDLDIHKFPTEFMFSIETTDALASVKSIEYYLHKSNIYLYRDHNSSNNLVTNLMKLNYNFLKIL